MEIEDIKRELAESKWMDKPEDSIPVATEELLAEIEKKARKMDAYLKRSLTERQHCGASAVR
jgi:hypothetical protein